MATKFPLIPFNGIWIQGAKFCRSIKHWSHWPSF